MRVDFGPAKTLSVGAIAEALGFEAEGDLSLIMTGAAQPDEAAADQLALAMDKRFVGAIASGSARAAILPVGAEREALKLEAAIFAPVAKLTLAAVTKLFDRERIVTPGVHSSAVVEEGAEIDESASIGPLSMVSARAVIGAGAVIRAGCAIGCDAVIGAGSLLHPGVRIGDRVDIGAGCIIHQNAVIGADGFSFAASDAKGVEHARATGIVAEGGESRRQLRVASIGSITIGSEVEIGANTTIDRGTVRDTRIGARTKIDNLVQIGHNVQIGEDCLICGQAGLAGSAQIGNRVVLGGQSGVSDQTVIGDDALLMASSAATGRLKGGQIYGGTPATTREEAHAQLMSLKRLPRLLAQLDALKNRFSKNDASG